MNKPVQLDDEQKKRLDDHVMIWIEQGKNRNAAMVPLLKPMCDGIRFPSTADPMRILDRSIQRLQKAKRIAKIPGHYGWQATKKKPARGKR